MKIILLKIIKLYWKLYPDYSRKPCLFKINCSKYIYNQTRDHGFVAGVKAFKFRYKNCKNEYSLFENPITGKTQMILKSNHIINEEEISPGILRGKVCR